MLFEKDNEEEIGLNYQLKKIVHMIELQIMDIESSLHYIQKKHTTHQLKEAFSQIYNIFNQTQPIFKHIKGSFLHGSVKKLMNCFGIIYVILNEHLDRYKHNRDITPIASELLLKASPLDFALPKQTDGNGQGRADQVKPRPFGGIYMYNQNYQRHLNLNRQPILKSVDTNGLTAMTKQEFTKSIMEEINDTSLSKLHPDQALDLFTFKFKYGKESNVVTFHDQLQSIAKYFKQAQNQAFEFLNKSKDQNSTLTYNESFKEIMGQLKVEKDKKLKQFNEKIKTAFKSIKHKTENKMCQIQTKLEEVEAIKNSFKPPETKQNSTQTSYNIDEELKYLNRKLEDAEQRYKLMHEIKRKEIEQSALAELALENEISLKAREIVYLKLTLEENSLVIKNLNKKMKLIADNQRKVKQKLMADISDKSQNKIMAAIEDLDSVNITERLALQSNESQQAIDSIKKQKKIVRKYIVETKRNALTAQFAKRYTQQNQLPGIVASNLLEKWNLSEISERSDLQANQQRSVTSNMNNLITEHRIQGTEQTKINLREAPRPSLSRQVSSQSIKSSLSGQQAKKKSTRQKKTSHFIDLHRSSEILNKKKTVVATAMPEDSILGDSESDLQNLDCNNEDKNQVSEEQMHKIQKMYQQQIANSKFRLNQKQERFPSRSPSGFYQPNNSAKQRYMSNHFQFENVKLKPQRQSDLSNGSMAIPRQNDSFRGSAFECFSIEQKQDDIRDTVMKLDEKDEEIREYIKSLQEELQVLRKDKQKLGTAAVRICQKQVCITIQPQKQFQFIEQQGDQQALGKHSKHFILESRTNKVKFQGENGSEYSELKTQKYRQLTSQKERKSNNRSQTRLATQMFFRSPSHSKGYDVKLKNATQHVKRPEKKNNSNRVRLNTQKNTEIKFYQKSKEIFEQLSLPEEKNMNAINKPKDDQIQQKGIHLCVSKPPEKVSQSQKGEIKGYKNNPHDKQNRDKQTTAAKQQQQRVVRDIALKCKNIKEFKLLIESLHKERCGEKCSHLQQYAANFAKYRQDGKERLKMHISNIHQSIGGGGGDPLQLPALRKKK